LVNRCPNWISPHLYASSSIGGILARKDAKLMIPVLPIIQYRDCPNRRGIMAEAEPTKAVVPAPNTLPAVPDTAKPATLQVTPDEFAQAQQLAAKIDLANPTVIATFGDNVQKKVGDF